MKNFMFLISVIFVWTLFTHFANATEMPYQLNYKDGELVNVTLKSGLQAQSLDSQVFLQKLRLGLKELQSPEVSIKTVNELLPGFNQLKPEEQQAYLEAQSLVNSQSADEALSDPILRLEFDRAVQQLKNEPLFHLIATTEGASEFDKENLLAESIDKVIDAAQIVLGTTPLFNVFEFLIEEYLEALISRREFVQNSLLVLLDSEKSLIDEATKNELLSSIYYSRIAIYNLPARNKAKKDWAEYGLKKHKKAYKKCQQTDATFLHPCFKHDGKKVYNLGVKKHRFSGKRSVAFNFQTPDSLRVSRAIIMASKFLLKVLPVPGFIKTPVSLWLNSFYVKQRKTEGLLYGASILNGKDAYAPWIIINSINPTIKF